MADIFIKHPDQKSCVPNVFIATGRADRTARREGSQVPVADVAGKLIRTIPPDEHTINGRRIDFRDPGGTGKFQWSIMFNVKLEEHGEYKLVVQGKDSGDVLIGNAAVIQNVTPIQRRAACVHGSPGKRVLEGGGAVAIDFISSTTPAPDENGYYILSDPDKEYFVAFGFTDEELDEEEVKFEAKTPTSADDSPDDDLWWAIFTNLGSDPGPNTALVPYYTFKAKDTGSSEVTVKCKIQ